MTDIVFSYAPEKSGAVLWRQGLLLALGSVGIVTAFASAFGLEYSRLAVWGTVIFSSAFAVFAFSCRYPKRYLFTALTVFYLLAALIFKQQIAAGFLLTGDVSVFLSAVMLPVVILLGYSVMYRFNLFFILLLTVPALEAGLFFNHMPSPVSFGAVLIFVLSALFMNRRGHIQNARSGAAARQAGNTALIAAAFLALLLAAAMLLLPQEGYSLLWQQIPFREQLVQAWEQSAPNQLFITEQKLPPKAGVSGGAFADTGKFEFTGESVLTVTTEKKRNSIYLKGYTGGEYTSAGWRELSGDLAKEGAALSAEIDANKIPTEMLSLDAGALSAVFGATKRNMRIENSAPEQKGVRYLPYFMQNPDEIDSGTVPYYDVVNYDNNLFLKDKNTLQSQLFESLANNGAPELGALLDGLQKREARYADYVQRAYTRLPDSVPDTLAADFGLPEGSYPHVEALIKHVAGRLSDRALYTLSPGDTPKDKDFAEYFLYENRKGYCTQFATAATLIFRQCGVPARYAEGYVITVEDYTKAARSPDGTYVITVKDTNAHAWCELYLDGFGWVPVEVTPGFASVPADGTAPEEGELTKYQDAPDSAVNNIDVGVPQEQGGATDNPMADGAGNRGNHIPFDGITALLILLLLSWRMVFKKKRITARDNAAVVRLYQSMARMLTAFAPAAAPCGALSLTDYAGRLAQACEIKGLSAFSEVVPVLQKALYSRSTVSEQEFEAFSGFVLAVGDALYAGLPFYKKIKWKWICRI